MTLCQVLYADLKELNFLNSFESHRIFYRKSDLTLHVYQDLVGEDISLNGILEEEVCSDIHSARENLAGLASVLIQHDIIMLLSS